jgi:hypothetical protein
LGLDVVQFLGIVLVFGVEVQVHELTEGVGRVAPVNHRPPFRCQFQSDRELGLRLVIDRAAWAVGPAVADLGFGPLRPIEVVVGVFNLLAVLVAGIETVQVEPGD